MKILLLPFLATLSVAAAQTTVGPVTISGHLDAYYSYESGDSAVRDRQLTPGGATPVYCHGRNASDLDRRLRYFHDFYFTAQLNPKFSIGGQFDVGFEHKSSTDHAFNRWHSGLLIARYQFSDRYAASARAEFYHDADGVTIATGTPGNFIARGGSIGLDYSPAKNLLWRLELRTLRADRAIFVHSDGSTADSTHVTSSVAGSF